MRDKFVKFGCSKFHMIVEFFMRENGFKLQRGYIDLFVFDDEAFDRLVANKFTYPEVWQTYEFFQILKDQFWKVDDNNPEGVISLGGNKFKRTIVFNSQTNQFETRYANILLKEKRGISIENIMLYKMNGLIVGDNLSDEVVKTVFK